MAATTCGTVGAVVTINVGTDDNVVVRDNGGNYELSINNNDWSACAPMQTDLNVIGSNAGNESFTFFHPGDFNNMGNVVDLGNGNDTLTLQDGGLPATTGGTSSRAAIADPANNDTLKLGTSSNGTLVGDMNAGGVADLRIDNAETIIMDGGAGDDSLDAGNIGNINNYVGSVAGNDIPAARGPFSADTTLIGGTGDDFLFSGDGNDNFQGGPGADGVSYQAASGPVVVDLQAATGSGMGSDTLSDVQDATGGRFDDTLTGSSLDNMLSGRGGADTIDAAAGDDTVHGGGGNDWLIGGSSSADGQDSYYGDNGSDTLDFSARTANNWMTNNNTATSGEGACPSGPSCEGDYISGSTENLWAGSGNDTLAFVWGGRCGSLVGNAGDDALSSSSDTCVVADYSSAPGPMVANLIDGTVTGDGNDTIDTIDMFRGTSGDDSVIIDENSDLDRFFAGAGTDLVDGSQATGSININLAELGKGNGIENLNGGSGDDELNGNKLYNTINGNDGVDYINGQTGGDNLSGGAGNDTIYGGDGNDTIEGGLNDDSLSGDAGADTLIYTHAPATGSKGTKGETIDNQLGFATGGDGQDSIAFFEIVKGSDFNDKIVAGQTAFDANNRLYGRNGNDQLTGSNSSDVLNGGGGKDQIRAGGGDDRVKGGSGNDKLYGSNGDDVLSGGKGHDVGWGGSGNDACHSIEQRHSC